MGFGLVTLSSLVRAKINFAVAFENATCVFLRPLFNSIYFIIRIEISPYDFTIKFWFYNQYVKDVVLPFPTRTHFLQAFICEQVHLFVTYGIFCIPHTTFTSHCWFCWPSKSSPKILSLWLWARSTTCVVRLRFAWHCLYIIIPSLFIVEVDVSDSFIYIIVSGRMVLYQDHIGTRNSHGFPPPVDGTVQ